MRIANEILMHFRGLKKTAGDLSLSDTLELDGDGNSLSFIDIISQDGEDMFEQVSFVETCTNLRAYIEKELTPREAVIIKMRYGLNGEPPKTQREVAELSGISRSYVSRIEKKALEKLKTALDEEEG